MSMILNLQSLTFSLLIVRPKKAFFDWLEPVLKKNGLDLGDAYFPEENGVWLIPAIGTFDDDAALQKYLSKSKLTIMQDELGKFGPSLDDMPPINEETCEKMFEFELRDKAQVMSP